MEVTEYEQRKLEFEKSLEIRNFEISNFWKRSWFFGALLIAIASGYYTLKTNESSIFPPIIMSFIGTIISIIQSLMNRGSKYWQERWEYKTKNRESALGIDITKTERYNNDEKYFIEQCILGKKENWLCRSHRWSVSKLTILVWDIISICCFLVWINDAISYIPNLIFVNSGLKIFIFHFVIILYIVYFYHNSKMQEHLQISQSNQTDKIVRKYTSDSL